MSALYAFGRYWKLGSDDLILPAGAAALAADLPLIIVFVCSRLSVEEVEFPYGCNSVSFGEWLTGGSILLAVTLLCDVAMFITAIRTQLFQPNKVMVKLVYLRTLLSICMLFFVLYFTFGTEGVSLVCISPSWDELDAHSRSFMKMLFGGYIALWVLMLAIVLFFLCAFQSRNPVAQRDWERRLRTYLCLRFLVRQTENDALSSMAQFFAELFRIRDIGHRLVPTDIAVGFLLIRSLQAKREAAGKIAEVTVGHSTSCHDGELPVYDVNCARIARGGEQPELPMEDWEILLEAKRFACFAVGSYGYKLHAITDYFCLCRGTMCGFGAGAYQTDRLVALRGSGCTCCGMLAPCACSHWNVNTFLSVTEMPRSHLHSCNLSVTVNHPVYYLSVCPKRKAIVLAVRGTLSVSDCITDCNCKNVPFAGPGLPTFDTPSAYYVHAGMFEAALSMRNELYEDGMLELAAKYPEHKIVVVGHSLGAGTASVLSVVLLHDEKFAPFRERLRCFAFAPPLIMSPALCTSPLVTRAVISIIWNHDIVSRLSMANLLKVRAQLEQCYEAITPNSYKWKIMLNAVQKRHSANWQVISDHHMDWTKLEDEQAPEEPYSPVISETKSDVLSIAVRNAQEANADFVTYVAGRIFHLLPRKGVPKSSAENGAVVYPASQETFQEIAIQTSMFTDHMPYLYSLKNIQFPQKNHI